MFFSAVATSCHRFRPSVSRAFALLNLGGASSEVSSTSMDGMLDYNPWWVDDYSNLNGILTI
jgi:hypothetical protein